MSKLEGVATDALKALCRAEGGTMTLGEIAEQLNLDTVPVRKAIEILHDDPSGALVCHGDDVLRVSTKLRITDDGRMECRSLPDCGGNDRQE